MNQELSKLILDSGKEIFPYLILRAYYCLNHELGDTFKIPDNLGLSKSDLKSLEESGFIRVDNGVITIYKDGWLGFPNKNKPVKSRFIEREKTILDKLIEITGIPVDYYESGKFNTKYPTLIAKIRTKYSDSDILEVARYAKIPLNILLTPRIFDEKYLKWKNCPKDREQLVYKDKDW